MLGTFSYVEDKHVDGSSMVFIRAGHDTWIRFDFNSAGSLMEEPDIYYGTIE